MSRVDGSVKGSVVKSTDVHQASVVVGASCYGDSKEKKNTQSQQGRWLGDPQRKRVKGAEGAKGILINDDRRLEDFSWGMERGLAAMW